MMIIPIQSGALRVEAELHDGMLRRVHLPEEAPEDADSSMLADVIDRLSGFSVEVGEHAPFYRRVWAALRQIPAGAALTYRELAEVVGSPRASRAVGQACAANPLLLLVPCHRVVAETGLGGFRAGLRWKQKLLEWETEAGGRQ